MPKQKKGLFQKLGLVEEVTPTSPPDDYEEEYDYQEEQEPEVEASLEEVNTDTLIDDIYAENGVIEKSRSIYKVQDVLNSLPKEMPTGAKRTTVVQLLGSFGLTVTEITDDGNNRANILRKIQTDINTDANDLIADYENQIESLKEQIAEKERLIAAEKDKKNKSNEIIDAELEALHGLINFIEEE